MPIFIRIVLTSDGATTRASEGRDWKKQTVTWWGTVWSRMRGWRSSAEPAREGEADGTDSGSEVWVMGWMLMPSTQLGRWRIKACEENAGEYDEASARHLSLR